MDIAAALLSRLKNRSNKSTLRLLDSVEKGIVNGINASQYQKNAKVSKATATRNLADLLAKECIEKLPRPEY
jgi:Fic family protein